MPADPRSLFDLSGKVALVTGGSRGLGEVMVRAFAAAGANVIVTSRKLDACERVAEEVAAETGRQIMAHACHVGHWDEIDVLVDAVYERFGKLDVVVNNAGMSPTYGKLTEVSRELFDKVVGVNFAGPFRMMAVTGSRMADDGGGSIINISTGGAIRPAPHFAPYAGAKAGLNAITVAFAHAYGPSVRVNAIMPGNFMTSISDAWETPVEDKVSRYALRRAGQPDEIAGAALYLASDASSYTTGAILRVDGGIP